MNVYLNDWSCAGDGTLGNNRAHLLRFLDLLKTLDNTNLCSFIIDCKASALTLCDFPMSQCYEYNTDNRIADRRTLLLEIFKYFQVDDTLDKNIVLSKKDLPESVLLGHAHHNGCPAISFCFNKTYAADKITGIRDGRNAEVANLHTKNKLANLAPLLFSRAECRRHNALSEPLWNTNATAAYMKQHGASIAAGILQHPGDKIHILKEPSTIIANLNGWVLDTRVTKLNSNDGAYRCIFTSKHFAQTAYLSVDFEKATVHFELHDKKGRHKGQFKWDGTHDDPDATGNHNIRV